MIFVYDPDAAALFQPMKPGLSSLPLRLARFVLRYGKSAVEVVNRNDCRAWEESGAKAAVGKTMTIADGGYSGTGLVMLRRRRGEELSDWKQAHNKSQNGSAPASSTSSPA
ncbi:hypothetical protein EDD93_3736 [Streptomyces sp. 840.1]|nr:hypothetical protein EDD93_3736 [Streptomyces sp. 840.1]